MLDQRFYYEPILSGHPRENSLPEFELGKKIMKTPIWVSSMTGGTLMAATINKNLATACAEFGMGMGLGSCRSLLTDDTHLKDFAVRKYIGNQPLFANLGIAQIERLWKENKLYLIEDLNQKLEADGLIIHVNPLQEWLQPEGDRYTTSPLELIKRLIDIDKYPIIVKEVGHGMGLYSLRALMDLPLIAIDFAANGGTNFSKIELARTTDDNRKHIYDDLANIGHSAEEMVNLVNQNLFIGRQWACKKFIISGGVKTFLDGYYLINKIMAPAVYGQAAPLLQYAMGAYEPLQNHLHLHVEGLKLAYALLKVKPTFCS
jgi:isopentenyl-diphosphate delta-isomerase